MAKTILVVATRQGIGLTSAVLGLYHALDRKGVKVGFHKPVMQYDIEGQDIDHSRAVLLQSSRAVGDDALGAAPANDLRRTSTSIRKILPKSADGASPTGRRGRGTRTRLCAAPAAAAPTACEPDRGSGPAQDIGPHPFLRGLGEK